MVSRISTVTFLAALLVGAVAACSDGASDLGGGMGNYHPGTSGPATGNQETGSSSGGSSSSGATSSSSGSSSGATSGSSSGSSGGTPEAGPPPLTCTQALAQVGSCMDFSQFTSTATYNVSAADIAKATVITGGGGNCAGCHNVGDNGFWASYGTVNGQDLTQQMFTETQQMPFILKWFGCTVDQNGQFKDVVASDAIVNQEAASQQCTNQNGTGCHPRFQLDPNLVSAINDFVNNTLTKWHSGQCSGTAPKDAGTD